jgi:hypothetical protein
LAKRSAGVWNPSVEAALGIRFPIGYREYVTTFGEGVLGGSFIRIYPPRRVSSDVIEWRSRIAEYWFWTPGLFGLSQERAMEGVIIGDTIGGDELVVHPKNPNKIFVLPRELERVLVAGKGLPAAIEWLCSSGVPTEAFKERTSSRLLTRDTSARRPVLGTCF